MIDVKLETEFIIAVDDNEYKYPLNRFDYVIMNIYNIFKLIKYSYLKDPDKICTHSIPIGTCRGNVHSLQISIFYGSIYYSIIERKFPDDKIATIHNSGVSWETFSAMMDKFDEIVRQYQSRIMEVKE